MALDFDEAFAEEAQKQPQSKSQSIADLASEGPRKLSIDEIAEGIVQTWRDVERQAKENKELQKRYGEELQKLEKMQLDLAKLISFFQEHKQAIQTSIYATSKYVIEEQAAKSISEIKKISAEAEKSLKSIEENAVKSAQKASVKTRGQKFILIAQTVLLILIFIKLFAE